MVKYISYFEEFRNEIGVEVVAVTFSRHGGVSPPPFDSLNVGFHVGDDPRLVMENRRRIRDFLDATSLVSAKQVHGCDIAILEDGSMDEELEGIDGIITDVPGKAIMVQHADCQAVVMFDPVNKVVANIHCGWRGNVQKIVLKAVNAMKENYCSRPEEIRVAVSPSLGPCCSQFKDWNTLLPQEFHSFMPRENYVDFWAITEKQLVQSGIRKENIYNPSICTVCSTDFFSYRRDGITGRCATVIMLRC